MAITTDIGFKNRLAFPTGVKVSVTVSGALYLAYSFLQFIFISSSFSRILHYCYIIFLNFPCMFVKSISMSILTQCSLSD